MSTTGKKEKKEKVPKEFTVAAPAAGKKEKVSVQPAGGGDAGEPVPSMIDLRVGKIIQGSLSWPTSSCVLIPIKHFL